MRSSASYGLRDLVKLEASDPALIQRATARMVEWRDARKAAYRPARQLGIRSELEREFKVPGQTLMALWQRLNGGRVVQRVQEEDARRAKVMRTRAVKQERIQRARVIGERVRKIKRQAIIKTIDPQKRYGHFVAKMNAYAKGKDVQRIPLLDYDEAPQPTTSVPEVRGPLKSAAKEYRSLLRKMLPMSERASILAGLARDPEASVRVKAMQIIHGIEGVNRKPAGAIPEKQDGGPLFVLAGGLPLDVSPVDPIEIPPADSTRES